MDDMQRYREIRDNADPDDPVKTLRLSLIVACDEALAEAIKLERRGRTGKVRALGFTATADLLDGLTAALRAEADELERNGGMVSAHWVASHLRFFADHGRRWPQPGEGPHIANRGGPKPKGL